MKKPPLASFSRLARSEYRRLPVEGCCFENFAGPAAHARIVSGVLLFDLASPVF
jgi:hypothetical protein